MDAKKKIIDSLEILRIRDIQSGEKFSALAYSKAIKELKKLDTITNEKDVEDLPGIGKQIKLKIKEIFETGELKAASEAKKDLSIDLYIDLLNVYGIGPVKAKELIQKNKITSIANLRQNQDLLNEKQKLGLKYYEDALERIPYEEMKLHEAKIMETIKAPIEATIVESYRRGAETSGDIDVLIKIPADFTKKQQKETLESLVKAYTHDKYIVDVLALGDKKCMAFVKLENKARRLDLLITPEDEYPYALLYFTGSDDFNVAFRKYALSKGYTMNEHIMKPKTDAKEVPPMKTEKDIFHFLGLVYKEPVERINENSVVQKEAKKLTMSEAMKSKKGTRNKNKTK